jgi:RimJ/RimL family protein N-acetyltransferase
LGTCPDVVLTVEPENEAAVGAYRRLGYEDKGTLIEGGVLRRDTLGIGALASRLLARLRARSLQQEVVPISVRTEEDTVREEKTTGNE